MATGEIWAYAEQRDGVPEEASLEVLGEAKRIAQKMGTQASAVLVGHEVEGLAPMLAHYGAARVYVADDPQFATYGIRPYARVVTALIQAHAPSAMLFGATFQGSDLAPRVAARLKSPMVAECVGLRIDEQDKYILTRPAYGGQVYANMVTQVGGSVLATIKPGAIGLDPANRLAKAEVIPVPAEMGTEAVWTRVLGFIRADPHTVDVREAEIIVSGGRGVGSKEGFRVIDALAEALDGSVAGTRPVVDAGWLPFERQIGQTGKTVAPKLYIACGISGASHHNIGMKDSKIIIAVNKDRHAAIFGIADVGIVGDLHAVLPELARQISAARQALGTKMVGAIQ